MEKYVCKEILKWSLKNISNKNNMQEQKISVVIRTLNEEKYLEECLKAIFAQNIDRPLEVIIVDSGSSDSTISIAQKFPVQILTTEKESFSYGKSLNIGCQHAIGEYVVFLSAHAIPINTEWLQELAQGLDTTTAGVFSKQVPAKDANPLVRRFVSESWKDGHAIGFSNTSCIIKKRLWERIRFDESLVFAEDIDWAEKIKREGYTIKYNPRSVVYHSHNDSLGRFFKRSCAELTEKTEKNKLFIYFRNTLHNLVDDIRYVIQHHENIHWLFYSFVLFFVKIAVFLKIFASHPIQR